MEYYTKEDVKRLILIAHLMTLEDDQAAEGDYLYREHHDDDETLFKLVVELEQMREDGEPSYELVARYKRIQNSK